MEIVTFRMKLADKLSKKEINAIASKYGIQGKNTSLEFIRKGTTPFSLGDLKFDKNERSVIKTITTAAKDRDDEIILPGGLMLDHYNGQPVVLAGHDYTQLGVGKSEWIKATDDSYAMLQKTIYAPTKTAEEYWKWQKAGFPMAASIGFIPMAAVNNGEKEFKELSDVLMEKGWLDKDIAQSVKRIYTKALLLEVSDVMVPSNQEAVMMAVAKGFMPASNSVVEPDEKDREIIKLVTTMKDTDELKGIEVPEGDLESDKKNPGEIKDEDKKGMTVELKAKETKETVTKPEPEETTNEIKIRVRDPEDFEKESFRRVTLQADKPRIFAVIGKPKDKDKTEVQLLRFPKADDWTIDKASKWAEDHDFKSIDFASIEMLQKWNIETGSIYKTIDSEGHPSVDDIINAIYAALRDGGFMEANIRAYIQEIYPLDYPHGHCVLAMWVENMNGAPSVQRFVDYRYTYEHDSKRITLFEPTEVEEQWALKSLQEKFEKTMAEKAELKEGQVLSRKNKGLVEDAYAALGKLLDATKKPEATETEGVQDKPKKPKLVMAINDKKETPKSNGATKMTGQDIKELFAAVMEEKIKESNLEIKNDIKEGIELAKGKAVYME